MDDGNNMVKEFAEKHGLIQQDEINDVEDAREFDLAKYLQLQKKKYVVVRKDLCGDPFAEFGSLEILTDRLEDGEEYCTIFFHLKFRLLLHALTEAKMLEHCKQHQLF